MEDAIWVTGVLVFALVFLWYAWEALKDNDSALAIVASSAAAGFVMAAGAYVWWLW
jgi:HAMP domain-containing protein